MKLDSKTLKYILYALIVIFFIILIGQYIKPPDIEGLENRESISQQEKIKIKSAIVKENRFLLPTSYSTMWNVGPFTASDISSIETRFTSNVHQSLSDLSSNIAAMKKSAGLVSTTGWTNAASIIGKYIDNMRLLGINLLLNVNGLTSSEISNALYKETSALFIKDYKANLDFMQDLKAYAESNSGGGGGGFLKAFIPSAKPGGFGGIN